MSQVRALDDDTLVIEQEVPGMRRAMLGSRASSRCAGQCLGGARAPPRTRRCLEFIFGVHHFLLKFDLRLNNLYQSPLVILIMYHLLHYLHLN